MNLKNIALTFFVTCAIVNFSTSFADTRRSDAFENSYSKPLMEEQKQQVLKSFTIYGEPITPVAINMFNNWLSDMAPSVIAMDLNSTVDSNQYSGTVTKRHAGDKTFIEVSNQGQTYGYHVLGSLGQDKVVIASYNFEGTGTGVWTSILVLKVSLQEMKTPSKSEGYPLSTRYLLLAEQVGRINIPDRGPYHLEGSTLTYADLGTGAGNDGKEHSVDLSSLITQ